ncbi:MAG: hypothetical protein GY737_05820 [Desulfobacteraceae bacterium]|nr:hypothetical protein [Desulfobacteraceae bacterium]
MLKRIITLIAALAILSAPAFAGDRPEFDCVGDDATNYFNDAIKNMVVVQNPWNLSSDFTGYIFNGEPMEYFIPPVQMTPDICFLDPVYLSAYTQWRRPAVYDYKIVLQMDPQSDLDINIVDCVVKHNSKTAFGTDPWEGADQTGRFQLTDGTSVFMPGANPMITVMAMPGPNAVFGFNNPFYLTNRTQGGLTDLLMQNLLYTSKALWEEGLVARMPEYSVGDENPLSAGDMLAIRIEIPFLNPVDIRYGRDNVCIKYVGIDGTIFTQ